MNVNLFYAQGIKGRIKLLKEGGEFIGRIRFHGYYIELYCLEQTFVEAYYNCYTGKLEEVELLDHQSERLNQFAVQVSLRQLYQQ